MRYCLLCDVWGRLERLPLELPDGSGSHAWKRLQQVQIVPYRKSIMDCCKCWNIFKAFFMILLIPFILVIALLAIIITFFFCVIGGFLFSPCYSRAQGYTTVATIFLCPCIGIYSVGYALSNVFCEMITTSCSHVKRYCNTIKALCSYSKSKAERQSTQLEIEWSYLDLTFFESYECSWIQLSTLKMSIDRSSKRATTVHKTKEGMKIWSNHKRNIF